MKVFLSAFAAIAMSGVIAFASFMMGTKYSKPQVQPAAQVSVVPLPLPTVTPNDKYPRAPIEAGNKEPSYVWMKIGTSGLTLNTLSRSLVSMNSVSPGDRIRLSVKAESGVSFGIATRDETSGFGFDPATQTCTARLVFDTTVECEAPNNPVLVIEDARKTGTAAAAFIARGRALDRAAAQNKVAINLFRYECVTWCTP